MKKGILLGLILFPLLCSAQHLKIKGVEINGNVNNFVAKMKAVGLSSEKSVDDGVTEMKGSFAGYNDCLFYIYSTKVTKTVYRVMVIFPLQQGCEKANEQFNEIKNLYTTKFNNFNDEWTFSYETECRKYGIQYDFSDGVVYLKLLPSKNNAVEYVDNDNFAKSKQESLNNALKDL